MDTIVKNDFTNVVFERYEHHGLSPRSAGLREMNTTRALDTGKILIVDDNDIEQLRASLLSMELGATVEVTSSARAALASLEGSGAIALVLMDCDMPGMSGLEAARRWRRIERGWRQAIPIVGLSRNAAADYASCLGAGMNDCLNKPLQRNDIAQCLARWTQGTRAANGARRPLTVRYED